MGDIHAPIYFKEFLSALNKFSHFNQKALVLLAGDLVDKGKIEFMKPVIRAISSKINGRIIGIFGNEEYDSLKEKIRKECSSVIWLDDEAYYYENEDLKIVIIGSRGVLDKPTLWQRRNIPNIEEIYSERLVKIESLLRKVPFGFYSILLTHYAPTYLTLEGEDRRIWSMLGSKRLERVLLKYQPRLAIHAHAHKSVRFEAYLKSTRVINVSFPARRDIVLISLETRRGLEKFLF